MSANREGEGAKRKVLVIDDAADVQLIIEAALGDICEVHAADHGQAGLNKAQAILPDLIICDMIMPGLNGAETIARLKSDLDTRNIPVLLMSGAVEELRDYPGLAEQVAFMIQKPFAINALREIVETVLGTKSEAS